MSWTETNDMKQLIDLFHCAQTVLSHQINQEEIQQETNGGIGFNEIKFLTLICF